MSARYHHVAILGAGVCGLAAAWELLRSGEAERVTILEMEDRPGGMARCVYDPSGLQADFGPHRIHTEIPEIETLLSDLFEDELIWVDRKSAMFVEGRFVDYPFSMKTVMGLYGPLELGVMGMSAVWGKLGGALSGPSKTFEEHMQRAFGRRLYRRVLRPYSEKVWKIAPSEISPKAAEVRVSAGSMGKMAQRLLTGKEPKGQETALKRFRYIRGGVEGLVKRLCDKVNGVGGEIVCRQPVEELVPTEGGSWKVRHSGGEIECDAIISTLPLPTLRDAFKSPQFNPPTIEHLNQLEYLAIWLVYLVVNRPHASENHWLYFPDEDLCFNRGYESKRFWAADNSPSAQTLLTLELTARPGTPLFSAGDDELTEMTVRDIERTGLVRRDEVVKSFVVRLPFGYPLYDCPADGHLKAVFDHLRQWPTLVTTGRQGLFSHNNMDHSMHMGLEAARALARGPEGVQRWYDSTEKMRYFRIVD